MSNPYLSLLLRRSTVVVIYLVWYMQALSAATQTELALDLATQVTGPSWYDKDSLYIQCVARNIYTEI